MSEKENNGFLAALDLGSSRTRLLIAEPVYEGDGPSELRFLGFADVDSQGWRKAGIADLDAVIASIKEAAERAEGLVGVPVESVVVGVGGPHIQGASASCGLTLSLRRRELTRNDVRRVMETARDVPLSQDREILHLVPEEFVLDSQQGIQDPIGMAGSYLGVRAHIITGSVMASANVVTAVNRAGILVEATVFEGFAAAEEVLSREERELGALVAVLGGGSCEIVAYRRGSLRMAAVVPIGGNHFTNDVALGLHTPVHDAEIMKQTFGSVLPKQSKNGTSVEVPGVGDRPSRFVPHRELAEILESRAEELFQLILEELCRAGLDHQLGGGVVLCGGGARLSGMCDLAEQILQAPARLGLPPKILDVPEALDAPDYATLIGLLLYSRRLWKMRAAAQNRSVASRWKSLIVGG